jgi:molecular chaperone GrpE (heat shock protein)
MNRFNPFNNTRTDQQDTSEQAAEQAPAEHQPAPQQPHDSQNPGQPKPSAETPQPAGDGPQITQRSQWVDLRSYAFEQAGRTLGDPNSLQAHLSEIREGRLLDESRRQELSQQEKDRLQERIGTLREEQQRKQARHHEVEQTRIPRLQERIEALRERIGRLRTGEDPDLNDEPVFDPFKAVFLGVLCLGALLFIGLFYYMAIYTAIFQDDSALQANASASSLFQSVFNVQAFYSAGFWEATMCFFAGFAPLMFGGFMHQQYSNRKYLFMGATALAALLLDGLLAYKIEQASYEARYMTGMVQEPWEWTHAFVSANFYLVLVFGFVTYFIWGMFYHEWHKEMLKRLKDNRQERLRLQKIQEEERKIDELQEEIAEHQAELPRLEAERQNLQTQIEQLQRKINAQYISKKDLLHSLDSFGTGWLQYVSNLPDSERRTERCREILESFKQAFQGTGKIELTNDTEPDEGPSANPAH